VHPDVKNTLEKEREQTSLNLAKAEEAMRSFSERTNVIKIDDQAKGMLEYIANLRATIDAKEVQLKVLRQQATPFNQDVIRLETEIKGVVDKLRDAESKAATCIGDVCLPTGKMPSLGLEYLRHYRDFKYQEILYQLYSKLVEITRLDVARNVSTVILSILPLNLLLPL
jgi:hypothetical protein